MPDILTPLLPQSAMATEAARRRLVMAVDGCDKEGKTHFTFTAPKPLVYFPFDLGEEGPLDHAPDADLIVKPANFGLAPSEIGWEADEERPDANASAKIQAAARPLITRFRATYYAALTEPVVQVGSRKLRARTVVIDTGAEWWELLRLVHFGKLQKVMPHHYAEVNGIARDMVRAGIKNPYDVNVIWTHKLKREWKEGADGKATKTNILERQGFADMAYLVQVNALCARVPESIPATGYRLRWKPGELVTDLTFDARTGADDLGFRVVTGTCRYDPAQEGNELAGELCTFPMFAAMTTGTDPDEWSTNR